MITTRESINYQFSLIFGYSSPDDLIVGDVVGPGKLAISRVKDLVKEVVKFLRMYNAILRDYSCSELFSIEFSLYNFDQKDAEVKIYPKSMILIPGKYKDCESLLLALKPETGYLDTHKSRKSIDQISKLFFEVEEFTDRPELGIEGKEAICQQFSNRFSQKLYGELIEDKWNKKLIGVSTSLPTDKELIHSYAEIRSDVDILWHKRPHEINMLNPSFKKIELEMDEQSSIDHLKYTISEPSANFVVENTLKLGNNLINLSNTGTIDETQDDIVSFLIKKIEEELVNVQDPQIVDWVISKIDDILSEIENYLNRFLEYSKDFLTTGEMGNISKVMEIYSNFLQEKGKLNNEDFKEICTIATNSIVQSITVKKELRAIELSSIINYISIIIKNSVNLIKRSMPKYLTNRKLKALTRQYIANIKSELNSEQKAAQILGNRLIDKFNIFLLNQIEITPIVSIKDLKYNEEDIFEEFKTLLENNIKISINEMQIEINALVSFAEAMMEGDNAPIKSHMENFKRFSSE